MVEYDRIDHFEKHIELSKKTIDYHIIILGDVSVGKSSLISKYEKDKFHFMTESTIGANMSYIRFKIKENDDELIGNRRITVWDTSGQERFKSLVPNYYFRADGVIIVYDITDDKSFLDCTEWLKLSAEAAKLKERNNVQYVLVGNKLDQEKLRKVATETGENFAINNKIDFFETSANDGTNVKNMFDAIIKKVFEKKITIERDQDVIILTSHEKSFQNKKKEKTSGCCVII